MDCVSLFQNLVISCSGIKGDDVIKVLVLGGKYHKRRGVCRVQTKLLLLFDPAALKSVKQADFLYKILKNFGRIQFWN